MNEELKQKVTAYLDGALPAAEAAAFEREVAKSPELLAELEEQRAVSKMLKDLPREKLPVGFLQRLERRRAGADAPREREWVFLAPTYRPFAAALSGLIVAVVVWDKVGERPLPVLPYEHAAVKSAADAPPVQFELAKNVAPAAADKLSGDLKKEADDAGYAATEDPGYAPPAVELPDDQRRQALVSKRERARAKGAPIGVEDMAPGSAIGGAGGGAAAGAASPAAEPASMMELAAAPKPEEGKRAAAAVRGMAQAPAAMQAPAAARPQTEEERSARNEEMYQAFEKEKRKMGIAGFAPKKDDAAQRVLSAAGIGTAPTRIDSATPNLLGAKDGVLPRALRSESAFRDAWFALKLPGDPPAVDFSQTMVVVLPEPGEVLTTKEAARELVVSWRRLPDAGPAERLRPLPLSGKSVRLERRD
jgi:hypothetical protein